MSECVCVCVTLARVWKTRAQTLFIVCVPGHLLSSGRMEPFFMVVGCWYWCVVWCGGWRRTRWGGVCRVDPMPECLNSMRSHVAIHIRHCCGPENAVHRPFFAGDMWNIKWIENIIQSHVCWGLGLFVCVEILLLLVLTPGRCACVCVCRCQCSYGGTLSPQKQKLSELFVSTAYKLDNGFGGLYVVLYVVLHMLNYNIILQLQWIQ